MFKRIRYAPSWLFLAADPCGSPLVHDGFALCLNMVQCISTWIYPTMLWRAMENLEFYMSGRFGLWCCAKLIYKMVCHELEIFIEFWFDVRAFYKDHWLSQNLGVQMFRVANSWKLMKTLNSRYARNVLVAVKEQHHHVLAKSGQSCSYGLNVVRGPKGMDAPSWVFW